jgi:ABC-type Co2+ transport system permease subunit
MNYTFDTHEMLTRLVKYLIEGLVVAIVAYVLPSKSLSTQEVILLALVAASIFSVLDLVAPAIGSSTRQGVGLATGFGLMGFP